MRALIIGMVLFSAAPAAAQVVINEIDYDQPVDDTAEFVELKNTGDAPVNLGTFAIELVNGSGGGAAIYQTIDLPDVELAAGDYFVVCANAATVPNCDLDVAPDMNLIQNGGPDAVGLRDGGVLVDTVSYEGDTGAPYTETSGAGLTDNPGIDFLGISRLPDGTDTDDNAADLERSCATPGVENISRRNDCVNPLTCGDGNPDANEECDAGEDNGTTECGCRLTCFFTVVDFPCGDDGDTECDDPDSCDGAGACLANYEVDGTECGDGEDTECDDPDTCDGAGVCQDNLVPVDTACGDDTDDDCTNPDTCDGAGACLDNHEAEDTACGDDADDDCTNPDTCDAAGVCLDNHEIEGTACGDGTDDDCTDPDTCDGSGACLDNHAEDGTACADDGLFCTGDESCLAGACESAGDPCDPETEVCDDDVDDCEPVGGDSDTDVDTDADTDTDVDADADTDTDTDSDGDGDTEDEGGCGCRTASAGGASLAAFLSLAGVLLASRRRRG